MGRAWRAVRDRFTAAGLATAALDARLLAERASGYEGAALVAHEHVPASPKTLALLETYARRRLAGEPVARILGEKEFYGLVFGLNAATLVPRPETEMLVDLGLAALKGVENPDILDLGTGTGCIVISLLNALPAAQGIAVDLSPEALAQARLNAESHAVAERLTLLQGSWFSPLPADARFDLIVSNPPYIPTAEIAGLDLEVKAHDPILALEGGADGLDPYRLIAQFAGARLKPGAALIVECGAGQGAAIAQLFAEAGFEAVKVHDDLAGIGRAIAGIWPG